MIDDAFLRHVAALQANLKMLESQSDALSDLADMKELRLYKSRLTEYIAAHTKAGNLPEDPFHVIAQRLEPISKFFTAAKEECKRLTVWKADWLKSVPAVSLVDLQSAKTELNEIVASNPQIQEYLRGYLSSIDWDISSDTVDLHPELLACAQCLSDLSLPQKAEDRLGFYLFAHNEGHAAKNIASHFEAVRLRIEELIELHEAHACAFVEAERHLKNHDFRKAEKFIDSFGKSRFSDLDYARVHSQIKNLQSQFDQFKNLESRIEERLQQGRYKETSEKIDQLRMLINKPDSELGRESLMILGRIETCFSKANKKRRKLLISALATGMVICVAIIFVGAYVEKKNELEKAKSEKAYQNFRGSLAGEEKVIEIAPGVTMTFCWCPPGDFLMGSPASEDDRDDYEDQVKVTLSKGFWMGKTEVTQAQWQAVMGNNPSHFKGANLPVESVSWNDAQEFLRKIDPILAATDGWNTMLPTEAQWEYAARAGESWVYSGSNNLDEVAWHDYSIGSTTNPVRMKKANSWGIHDMSGNVMEWCRYWCDDDDELLGGVDPTGASSGPYRMLRGGSWNHLAADCRVASRLPNYPTNSTAVFGFRVVRCSAPSLIFCITMSIPKYSQLHRKLLFHWTGPRPVRALKSRDDRVKYLELLVSIIDEGLRFSVPDTKHTEWIVKNEIRATHPMLCFSEWGVSESNAHSGRYGYMGLGFTRKFVMGKSGRPIVYIPNNKSDPFRQALVEMIQAVRGGQKDNSKLNRHADLLASYLKSYNFNRTTDKKPSNGTTFTKSVRKKRVNNQDDHLLRLDFGGLFANLEDREWRIIPKRIEDGPQHLKFKSGDLAMVVFPDHQTLSLAMQCDAIMKRIILPGRPSVCMVSREVIQSV